MDSKINEVSELSIEIDEFNEAPCCGAMMSD
jgi:hypothetical protein